MFGFNIGRPRRFLDGRIIGLFLAAVMLSTGCLSAGAAKKPQVAEPGGNALIFKPNIEYPYEARRLRQTGSGIVVVDVNPATGLVTRAYMGKSTGHGLLDTAAVTAFRGARFRPGTPPQVRIPITFSAIYGVRTEFETKARNMDDVLAPFLGKGTVLHGPIPHYPKRASWTHKRGKGVYKLHVNQQGRVDEVEILASSGDETFDRVAVGTLRKWRLRRGPLTVELPLSFTLTPDSFAVQIPKHESLRQRKAR
jgi:TonB family protein